MTYAAHAAAISHTPVDLVKITLDYCSNTFGSGPCTATGSGDAKCYNTYFTCKDRANFTKTTKVYSFVSCAPVPFGTGERPYISKIEPFATEIYLTRDENDKIIGTSTGRESVTFLDEPDTDVGIDPYYLTRTYTPADQGTFWRKLYARNPNLKGRPYARYHGFLGDAEAAFEQRFKGVLDTIKFTIDGSVTLEAVDVFKKLGETKIPAEYDIKVASDITASGLAINLNDATGLASSGYLLIGQEIIKYDSLASQTVTVNAAGRGYADTTAAAHNAEDKAQPLKYFSPASPFAHLLTILDDADIDAADIDTTAFTDLAAWDSDMPLFEAWIMQPTTAETLYFEILELVDCRSWIGEDLKVTIRKNVPNDPDRTYTELSDSENIAAGDEVDLNPDSRVSKVILYWNKSPIGVVDDPDSYERRNVEEDSTGNSVNAYNEAAERTIYCRWLADTYMNEDVVALYVKNLMLRIIAMHADGLPFYDMDTTLKDCAIQTGDFIKITTDAFCQASGAPISGVCFQVVRREMAGDRPHFKTQKFTDRKIGYIAADAAADWDSATDAEKESGYITQEDGTMDGATEGYYIY
jgi:hypothetical protein